VKHDPKCLYPKSKSYSLLVSEQTQILAKEIFKIDSLIQHLGVIDLEGNVLLDQSSAAHTIMEPDPDRVAFYKQLAVRRSTREHFDEAYGKTNYIHITRERMQQMILYLPNLTIYLTLGKPMTPDEVKNTAQKIRLVSSDIMKYGI